MTFIFIKVGSLHSLAHSDDIKNANDCVWCHLSGTDSNTPIISAETDYEITPIIIPEITREVQLSYHSVASSKTPVCLIFNKPPPFYTV
ncbi:hypothetical protein [Mesonia maritima]|uniref:Uncharacterized protein n=1 Tax=Mesonia maritima TaxID=1793873 RepID=A0ABU1K597_9FLAO|nr:hypothetical protein [Mesonia maritima]MDR6299743.1 hypothetical protein [Mesonia maritima]